MIKSKTEKNVFKVWEGIYENFPEAKKYSVGNGFSGKKYSLQALNLVKLDRGKYDYGIDYSLRTE